MKHWRDAGKRRPAELSVNCADCIGSPTCSIQLNPNSGQYYHVVEFDLAPVIVDLDHVVVARYDPLTDEEHGFENPCHFVVVSKEDSAVAGLQKICDAIDDLYYARFNGTEADLPEVHRNVRQDDGTLLWI